MKKNYFILKALLGVVVLVMFSNLNAQTISEWYASSQERIDTLRKGDFGIQILDKDGQPFLGDVQVKHIKHEYPFGIAFDLYEGEVNNGNVYSSTNSVDATTDAEVYQSERWNSFIAYAVPVEKDRDYKLTLKFAEIYFDSPGSRIFDVFVEGTEFLTNFDVVAVVGSNNLALDTTLTLTASDTMLNIELISSVDNAAIKALVVETVEGDSIIRINCGGEALTTTDGNDYLSDAGYADLKASRFPTQEQWMKATMQKYFNYGVSGNSFKWSGIQPQHTEPDYTNFNHAVEWTQSIGWELRAHTLLWGGNDDHSMPGWVRELPTPEAITDTCKMRVIREVTKYKGIVKEYDVINEPLTGHADWLQNTVGDSINWNCFKWARSADPDAELFINDYNVEYNWGQAREYRDLINQIKAEGAPITGVGMQAHFWEGMRPQLNELVTNINIVAEAGLPIKLTEFDNGPASEQELANDFVMVTTIAFSHPMINGFINWALSDAGAWREGTGLFYADHRPKKAADTLLYLTKELWTTRFDSTLASSDPLMFNGYHGDYSIEVNFNDTIKVFTIPCYQVNNDSVFILNENEAQVKGPSLVSVQLSSDNEVVLTFDKTIDEQSLVSGDFKFYSDTPMRIQHTERSATDDKAIIVRLQELITPDDFLQVSYFPGSLSSADGGLALAFGPEIVANLTTGLTEAEVIDDGYVIQARFSHPVRNLNANEASFAIKDNGQSITFSSVEYIGTDSSRIQFNLETPITPSSEPTLQYTQGTLVASNGFNCQSSGELAVVNLWPEIVSATVAESGTEIELKFNTKLQNVSANLDAFSIDVSGNLFDMAGISESGTDSSTVTIDLEYGISEGFSVTLSYQPGTIKGINGNSLPAINQASVRNNSTLTGLNSLTASEVNIMPNPARSMVQIDWEQGFNQVVICNIEGKKILEENYARLVQSGTLNFNLEAGIYLVYIKNDQSSQVQKLIIE